jgi:hypothetical protein
MTAIEDDDHPEKSRPQSKFNYNNRGLLKVRILKLKRGLERARLESTPGLVLKIPTKWRFSNKVAFFYQNRMKDRIEISAIKGVTKRESLPNRKVNQKRKSDHLLKCSQTGSCSSSY